MAASGGSEKVNVPLDTAKLSVMLDSLGGAEKDLLNIYLGEAQFFWKYLLPIISSTRPARALEVGSGVGLLSLLASTEISSVTALEPESSGFSKMGFLRQLILDCWDGGTTPAFHEKFIDDLPEGETFDLVFCINVLEHVGRRDDLVRAVYERLNPGGTAWFVCPNYLFPYEQHFEIPILLSKGITEKVFRRRIARNQKIPDPTQMWEELSWPTHSGIRRLVRQENFPSTFKKTVLAGYFDRLSEFTFLERKGSVYKSLLPLILLLKPLVLSLPHHVLPIVEFTLSKPCGRSADSSG